MAVSGVAGTDIVGVSEEIRVNLDGNALEKRSCHFQVVKNSAMKMSSNGGGHG
jgi:hypothetical protein